MTRRLSDLTLRQVDGIDHHGAVLVQPIGAIEQHGPHLPLCTDALRAERAVDLALDRLGADVPVWSLPTLSYGKSVEHAGLGATVALTSATLAAVCLELGRSLAASGFRKLAFVNGHGGQPGLLESVARDIRLASGLQVFPINLGALGVPDGVEPSSPYDIHAGRQETSIMLALAPELVHPEWAVAGDGDVAGLYADRRHLTLEGAVPTAWLTRDLTSTGVIGDPSGASAAEGRRIIDHRVTALAAALTEIVTFEFPFPTPEAR